jgi:D-alanyl-D-alanine carboxypeptidase
MRRPDRRSALLPLALLLATLLLAAPASPTASVAQAATAPPLPACTVGEVITPRTAYTAFRTAILDTRLALPRGYSPPDLVSTALAGLNRGQRVRKVAIPDLRAMASAARKAGVRLLVDSGYRSYAQQAVLYRYYVNRLGLTRARLRVARPGHSEHQLGTAIDLASTPGAYLWAKASSWKFGWIVSYPYGQTRVSCYQFEPWHLRYVGRTMAASVHASQLVLRAWLWLHVPVARRLTYPRHR